MFCPVCRCEYRPGFSRCATCEVDLVPNLDGAPSPARRPATMTAAAPRSEGRVQFCGFQVLDEAQQARGQLHERGIGSDILIRQATDEDGDESDRDEYWLLVGPSDFRAAQGILGYDLDEAGSGDTVFCSSCGEAVDPSDDACPHCGEKFEEA